MPEQRFEQLFEALVDSVGVKAFAMNMGLSTRQIYRMLNGVQPNPIERFCQALRAGGQAEARQALDSICQEHGGYLLPHSQDVCAASVNAVKESAEAIVAISEDRAPRVTIKEIREAIAALADLERRLMRGETFAPMRLRPIGLDGAPAEGRIG